MIDMTSGMTELKTLATNVRATIDHRRCLICGKHGDLHRIVIDDSLHVTIVSEDGHHRFDPGERRIGLPR